MNIKILDKAETDLIDGFNFYERQQQGLGDYFLDSLFSDIDSLGIYAGIHPTIHSHYRLLAKRFPFSIYYTILQNEVYIHAILDCRRDPAWIRDKLL